MAQPEIDISQLSESQQMALQTYTSVTDQEPLTAIPLLQRCEWNVQIAIARFFDGEPTSDILAEARAALPAPSARQTTNLQYESLLAASRPTSPRRPPADTVERIDVPSIGETQYQSPIILSLLFAPVQIVYRLFSSLLSPFGFLMPTFLFRLFRRLTTPELPRPTRQPLPPAENARRFIREFTQKYAPENIPTTAEAFTCPLPFAETGFNLALDTCKKDLKYLLVVLLPPNHDDTPSYVRDSLLSPQFSSFLANHSSSLMLWGGNLRDPEAYSVATMLKCTKFPFLGLIAFSPSSTSSPSANSGSMALLARLPGPTPAATLCAKLGAAITSNNVLFTNIRAAQAERSASHNLRQEQDSAYERSLARDREIARQRREKAEASSRAEKAALEQEALVLQRERQRQHWRRWRACRLHPEPETSGGKAAVRVSIRLPSGERIVRKFCADDALEELYAFVECHGATAAVTGEAEEEKAAVSDDIDISTPPAEYTHEFAFRLVSPMPRTVFALDDGDNKKSIGERFGRAGGNLIVEQIASNEDEDEDEDEDEEEEEEEEEE